MNSDKLNSIIRNKAKGSNDLSLHLHQMFFFEHVLMRISESKYKDNIILKGGVLLSSILGEDMRTTKDMDTTLKSLPLTKDFIQNMFEEILSIAIDDGVSFCIESVKDIRLEDDYGGFRINVFGTFDKLKNNFFIEVTTGDIITPREIEYQYQSIFEDKKINIFAYTIETIIAEKFHAIITKNVTSTRSKDFYDMYMLMIKNKDIINQENLIKSLKNTFNHRNTKYDIDYFNEVIKLLETSLILKDKFDDYKKKLEYAKYIEYEDTIFALKEILHIIEME